MENILNVHLVKVEGLSELYYQDGSKKGQLMRDELYWIKKNHVWYHCVLSGSMDVLEFLEHLNLGEVYRMGKIYST